MHLERLWLTDFRNYKSAEMSFPSSGLTLISGDNGQGKSNLLEAIGYVALLRSFRNSTSEALVRVGEASSYVRGEGVRGKRQLLVETEIPTSGRTRVLLNKQPVVRADPDRRLLATVFSPDDLTLVKGGPAERRTYLDDLLSDRSARTASLVQDLARILKQRNALLRQCGGHLSPDAEFTLDVWDSKFADVGEALAAARDELVGRLVEPVNDAYSAIAGSASEGRIGLKMFAGWRSPAGAQGLLAALRANRSTDVARSVTTIGPHRDDCNFTINGMSARTHASQGEQRTLSLALRLASHRLLALEAGEAPLLLLDDVFSELDDNRSRRLLESLPGAQTFLTATTGAPEGSHIDAAIEISQGTALLSGGVPN